MHEKIKKEDFRIMNELHVLISSLKAYYMDYTIMCMFAMRECSGGHGYSSFTGFGNFLEGWSPNVTLEGDGFVLYQQTTKKLIKMVEMVQDGKKINTALYPYIHQLAEVGSAKEMEKDIREPQKLLDIIRVALSYQLLDLIKKLKSNEDIPYDVKWNKAHQVEIAKIAMMHALYMSSKAFIDGIQTLSMKKDTVDALWILCKFFMCDVILKHGEYALLHNYIDSSQLMNIQSFYYELMEEIRPRMVALVEAPIITEQMIQGTAVGDKSDDYCTNLYDAAKFSKLNTKEKLDVFERDLKPLSQKLAHFAKL